MTQQFIDRPLHYLGERRIGSFPPRILGRLRRRTDNMNTNIDPDELFYVWSNGVFTLVQFRGEFGISKRSPQDPLDMVRGITIAASRAIKAVLTHHKGEPFND